MNLNKVLLIGRVAADPETRNTNTGQNVSTLRMATNRVWMNKSGEKQEQAEFHTVILWGKLSDIADKYVQRGQLIMIEGRLQTRSWQGNDGVKRYRTEIVAEGLQMGPKSAGGGSGSYSGGSQSSNYSKPSSPKPVVDVKEEDIPVINQDEPTVLGHMDKSDIDEAEIDLKDIPF